jgi:predicted extracellular nuclease
MKNHQHYLWVLFFLIYSDLLAQKKEEKFLVSTLAFYNVENLFDTISSVDVYNKQSKITQTISDKEAEKLGIHFNELSFTEDLKGENRFTKLVGNDDFTPIGARNWTKKKYKKKSENTARVIANIGFKLTKSAPVIVGLAEIENEQVLIDLVSHPFLSHYKYKIVHQNSFDARGIECALIYQSNRFTLISQKSYSIELSKSDTKQFTRDILWVSGELDGERFSFLVNHWPSRRGGEKVSESNRIKAAEKVKMIIEQIKTRNPKEKIVVMGDFNDNPNNKSIKSILLGQNKKENLTPNQLYNPTENLFKNGMGTTAFRDNWFLFDQMLVNDQLTKEEQENYQFYRAEIFSPAYLKTQEGKYKGYPKRSFDGDIFNENGFSDHFPVYLYLKRRATN